MATHFYMPYAGNKIKEAKHIFNNIENIEFFDTIVEPFAGTSAISFSIWQRYPNKKFILNDNNKYLKEIFEMIRSDAIDDFENSMNEIKDRLYLDKNFYKEKSKEKNLSGWFIYNTFYNLVPGCFPLGKKPRQLNFKKSKIYNFYKTANIEFLTEDGLDVFTRYKTNPKNFIFIDPPYLTLNNDFYKNPGVKIYEFLNKNNIQNDGSKIVIILQDMWIVRLIFPKDKFKYVTYQKNYGFSKKKVQHLLLTN